MLKKRHRLTLFAPLTGVLIIIAVLHLYSRTFILPNTYLSRLPVAGKSEKQIKKILKNTFEGTIQIRVKNRVYPYRYRDLGLVIDSNNLIQSLFEENTKPFPGNITAFLTSFGSQQMLLPTIEFTHDFYNFSLDTIYDFSKKSDEVTLDETEKKIVYTENEEKYRIDPESLKQQIIFAFGKSNPVIEPALVKVKNEKKLKVTSLNQILENVFKKPVHIRVQDDAGDAGFVLKPEELKKLVKVTYHSEDDKLGVVIEDSPFRTLIDNLLAHLPRSDDKKLSTLDLKNDLVGIINARANEKESDTIIAKRATGPNTSGDKAEKYIEVDISQQKMYLFKSGTIAATYQISSGLYYPTPTGEFKIMNKATNAFSDIYNVWMPFWMGFAYSSKLKAYFGIHELPYWVAGNGARIQRPREFIGTPRTGGCIALDIGTAQEVYTFADVGTPLYVFN